MTPMEIVKMRFALLAIEFPSRKSEVFARIAFANAAALARPFKGWAPLSAPGFAAHAAHLLRPASQPHQPRWHFIFRIIEKLAKHREK